MEYMDDALKAHKASNLRIAHDPVRCIVCPNRINSGDYRQSTDISKCIARCLKCEGNNQFACSD